MADTPTDRRIAHVPARSAGQRLDQFLREHFPSYSRRQLADVIRSGKVHVDGHRGKPGTVLAGGERLELPIIHEAIAQVGKRSRDRQRLREGARTSGEVEVLHRDDDLLVVVKPPGVPVHGGARLTSQVTLLDLLRADILDGFGLVHRLDRDTTGAIALVRGAELRAAASELFAQPDGGVEKVYEAIVEGVPEPPSGEIDAPLTSPGHRGRVRVDPERGRQARTGYTLVEAFSPIASRLRLNLYTGRTHQIRAHLLSIGHPLLVDRAYGNRGGWRLPDPRGRLDARLRRTPLHASQLTLPHPRTGERMEFRAPVPPDMKYALEVLRVQTGKRS